MRPPSTFAGHAYDALHIIVEAMMTLDEDFTPEELRDAIEATRVASSASAARSRSQPMTTTV